jgi:transposase
MMSFSARVTIEPEPAERPSRRRNSIAEKRRIVEATLVAGSSVARVAREHGVNANMVFCWRRLYQRGLLGGNAPATALVPAKVAEAPAIPEPALPATPSGSIHLRLPKGHSCGSTPLRIRLRCASGWSACSDDQRSCGHADLDRGRGYRSALRLSVSAT